DEVIFPVVGAMAYTSTIRVDIPFPISVNALYCSVSAGPCMKFEVTSNKTTTKRSTMIVVIMTYSMRVLTPFSAWFLRRDPGFIVRSHPVVVVDTEPEWAGINDLVLDYRLFLTQ